MGKKKGKKKSKAQLAQEATDLLAVGLDRAQLSVNNAGPGEDVAVLKLVIEKKKAAFAKGAQRHRDVPLRDPFGSPSTLPPFRPPL